MPVLRFRFPAGRYHATPSGHHVNEGLVEWPPSPWRLVRALIACGYTTQGWKAIPPAGRRLIEALSSTLPRYALPEMTIAHSRHYMPLGAFKDGREATALVLDAWANVGDQPLFAHWDVELDAEARELLGALAGALGYLGRSESYVEAQLCEDAALPGVTAFPAAAARPPGQDWEQVSLLAPVPAAEYASWRETSIAAGLAAAPEKPAGKRASSAKADAHRAQVASAYPEDLIDALQRDTAWWKQRRWSQAPGSRHVLYWRQISSAAPAASSSAVHVSGVGMMLLEISTANGRPSTLPLRARTLPQAELIHRALAARLDQVASPVLTGRGADRRPLTGHGHAHVLPLDLDSDGRLDHVLIHAEGRLDAVAQAAIGGLRRTWTKGGAGDLRLVRVASGELGDLRTLPSALRPGVEALLGPVGGARAWVSDTVFVPPRYLKPRGRNTLEGQVHMELDARGLPARTVDVLPWHEEYRALRHMIRVRQKGARPPQDAGFVVRLVFEEPWTGPLSIGYGAHFGLGRFRADD
jgi:CRISPR-associated protein Csb2